MGLIIGWYMTVSSHAQVLSSSTGVYVLLISLITCRIVHKFEVIGYVIALFGVIIMLSDPFAMKQAGKTNYLLGNVISLTGAGFAAIIWLLSNRNCQIFHPMVLLTHMYFFYVVIQLLVFPYFQDIQLFYSFDSESGAFGWISNIKNLMKNK